MDINRWTESHVAVWLACARKLFNCSNSGKIDHEFFQVSTYFKNDPLTLQIACRKNQWPLDSSTLHTYVTNYVKAEEIEQRLLTVIWTVCLPYISKLMYHVFSKKGAYIHGLWLEGASWDQKKTVLKPLLPNVLIEPLPILVIAPIEVHRVPNQVNFVIPSDFIWIMEVDVFLLYIVTEQFSNTIVRDLAASKCYGRWACIWSIFAKRWHRQQVDSTKRLSALERWLNDDIKRSKDEGK